MKNFLFLRCGLSALAMLLRARTLIDIDCWSEVKGQAIKPSAIRRVALDKLQAKSDLEGLERMTATRCRFVKPHLARQRAVSDAIYNRAKRERIRLVEEMVLDRKLVPF